MTFGGYHIQCRAVDKVTKAANPVNDFWRLIAQQERKLQRALNVSYEQIREVLSEKEIVELINSGRTNEIIQLASPAVTDDALQTYAASFSEAANSGAALMASQQSPVRNFAGDVVNIIFDATNPRVTSFARINTAHRVREIGDDVRDVIQTVITNESTLGNNPLSQARRIRDSIGLTSRQEMAVTNYRRALENRDIAALDRELRDRRFDATVRSAFSSDRDLTPAQINRMTQRYRERYIKYRSQTIARTEAIRAVNGGSHELIQSYIESGKIAPEQVRRFWYSSPDEKTRSSHRQAPMMNQDGVGIEEPFQTPLGPLMFPGDPGGSAANVINCRCTVFNRIISAELLEDPPAPPKPPKKVVQPKKRPPPRRRTTPPVEPSTTRFTYQELKPPGTVAEADAFYKAHKIAKQGTFNGLSDGVAQTPHHILEVKERFGLGEMSGIGNIRKWYDFDGRKIDPPLKANGFFGTLRYVKYRKNGKIVSGNFIGFGDDFGSAANFRRAQELNEALAGRFAANQKSIMTPANSSRLARTRYAQMQDTILGGGEKYGWSFSSTAKTVTDQVRRTAYHELGHSLRSSLNPLTKKSIDRFFKNELYYEDGWQGLVSEYAGTSDDEYLAETFSLYMEGPQYHYRIHPELLKIFRSYDKALR